MPTVTQLENVPVRQGMSLCKLLTHRWSIITITLQDMDLNQENVTDVQTDGQGYKHYMSRHIHEGT